MSEHMQPFPPGLATNTPMEGMQMVPRVDVVEVPGEIIYIFEVPGVELNSVNVEIGHGSLLIDGQVETGLPTNDLNYLYQERSLSKKYSRLLSIPPEVDHENAAANVKSGLLMVRFPKKNTGRRLSVNLQEQPKGQEEKVKPKRKKHTVNHPEH